MDPLVARINALYKKQKSSGLSDEEKAEQAKLRRQYVDQVKGNLKATLDNTTIVYGDGTKKRLGPDQGTKKH